MNLTPHNLIASSRAIFYGKLQKDLKEAIHDKHIERRELLDLVKQSLSAIVEMEDRLNEFMQLNTLTVNYIIEEEKKLNGNTSG